MRWGVSGQLIDAKLPYAAIINRVCVDYNFPPPLAYAIAWNETLGEYGAKAAFHLEDGYTDPNSVCGHGIFQLTSWWPDDWMDPYANTRAAVADWLLPDAQHWFRTYGLTGEALVKCVAASFNAGFGAAEKAHLAGDVDSVTTAHYAARALDHYQKLVKGETP